MTKRKAPPPMPIVGDFVVVAHQMVDPHFWWVSQAEWVGAGKVLVRERQGWHPTYEALILQRDETILAFGTEEDCRKLVSQARSKKDEHLPAIRDANAALQAAQHAAREAIRALVDDGNKRLFGDVTAIEP